MTAFCPKEIAEGPQAMHSSSISRRMGPVTVQVEEALHELWLSQLWQLACL